jgi:hypothetical protein
MRNDFSVLRSWSRTQFLNVGRSLRTSMQFSYRCYGGLRIAGKQEKGGIVTENVAVDL